MDTIKFLLVVSIALLSTDLVYHQIVNGQGFDISELQTITAYCFLHADSDNPINDLVKQGLVDPYWKDWKCGDVNDLLQRELQKQERREEYEAQEKLDFTRNCMYGNLTPSELSQCMDADITTFGPLCLYDEERVETYYTKSQWDSGAFQLTPEELSECKNKGYTGSGGAADAVNQSRIK